MQNLGETAIVTLVILVLVILVIVFRYSSKQEIGPYPFPAYRRSIEK